MDMVTPPPPNYRDSNVGMARRPSSATSSRSSTPAYEGLSALEINRARQNLRANMSPGTFQLQPPIFVAPSPPPRITAPSPQASPFRLANAPFNQPSPTPEPPPLPALPEERPDVNNSGLSTDDGNRRRRMNTPPPAPDPPAPPTPRTFQPKPTAIKKSTTVKKSLAKKETVIDIINRKPNDYKSFGMKDDTEYTAAKLRKIRKQLLVKTHPDRHRDNKVKATRAYNTVNAFFRRNYPTLASSQ